MNLEAFRERVYQLYRRVLIYDGRKPTQQDLADALGLSRGELSRRLHGYGTSKLTRQDIYTIIRTLVIWEAIGSQAEALELFGLAACPPPTAAEWQVPPLDQLEVGKLVNVSTSEQALLPKVYLPLPLTSFVGRDSNIAEIGQLLGQARLLTLIGAGGAGKTRLALELGRQLSSQFPDGVRQVELARLRDAHLLTAWLASAFDVSEPSAQPLLTTLSNYLQPRRLLLILDNCEHLVAGVAELVTHLLSAAPHLVILTTSREALRVAGEVLYPVPPLPLPELGRKLTPAQLARYEAIRLFIERARLVDHHFELNQANAGAIRQICERLDGLPLAIELAAARLAVLSVEQLLARMTNDCFPLLTMGARTALPHQQTLRASIDWSYDLLSPAERLVFAIAVAMMNLGNVAYAQSDFVAARSYMEHGIKLMRTLGDNQRVADAYGNLGNIMLQLGQWSEARRLYEQVIEIKSGLDDSIGVATWTTNLADVLVHQGEYARAHALYRQCLTAQCEMANREGITTVLEGLALLALHQGDMIRSTRLYAAAEASRALLLTPRPLLERDIHEANLARLRQQLSADEFNTQWAIGEQLSLSQAVEYALAHTRLS